MISISFLSQKDVTSLHGDEINEAATRVVNSGWYLQGEENKRYMFKGTSLIFVLLFSALIFNETITLWNIVGASLIVGGIVWFAKG